MSTTPKTGEPSEEYPTAGNRMEKLFSRLGLVTAALLLPLVVLLIDLLLTRRTSPVTGAPTETFDMYLVTHDGRDIGGARWGVPLALSPMTLYENLPGQSRELYRTNSLGLRGSEVERTPGKPRVIVVGGSTAFGLLVREHETLAAGLQARFPQLEVLNAGVVGYLSTQELGLVVFKLLDLGPGLIIMFDGWNDLYDNYWWAIFGDPGVSHRAANVNFNFMENRLVNYRRLQESPWFALGEATRAIVRHSTILSALSGALRSDPPSPVVPKLDADWAAGVGATYVSNVVKLRDVAGSRDCGLLVVLQPELGQLLDSAELARLKDQLGADFLKGDRYWNHFPDLYQEFRGEAVRSLAERGVNVVDGSEQFRGDTPAGSGPTRVSVGQLFVDPVHLSPAGHAHMADLLGPHVERMLRD